MTPAPTGSQLETNVMTQVASGMTDRAQAGVQESTITLHINKVANDLAADVLELRRSADMTMNRIQELLGAPLPKGPDDRLDPSTKVPADFMSILRSIEEIRGIRSQFESCANLL